MGVITLGGSGQQKHVKKNKRKGEGNQTAHNSRHKEDINQLVSSTLRQYSTERVKRREEEVQLSKSRRVQVEEMKEFGENTRRQNLKRFPPKQGNTMNERLPWGADEIRIKKHVVQIIEKLNKIRNPSKSSSRSPVKRNRKEIGMGFLDKLSPERVERLVLRSQRSSKDLSSSHSMSSRSKSKSHHVQSLLHS